MYITTNVSTAVVLNRHTFFSTEVLIAFKNYYVSVFQVKLKDAVCFVFFFFSSRRRHTRFDCDWSSDVCSSDLADLRPLSGVSSSANDISEPGEIVGGGDTGFGDFHAYLLSEGTGFDLGTLGGNESEALAVNRLGQVAGHSRTRGGVAKRAFFVPEPGRMLDLGSLGGAVSIAHDVNDGGEVTGFAETSAGPPQ